MITYNINTTELKKNYEQYRAFGPVYFPVKTNHNPIILNELKKLGSGFEVDSVEHIKKVYSPKIASKIMYSNVAKSRTDIIWAIKHKISYYTVDDEESLSYIIDSAVKYKLQKLKINIRLNVYECFKDEFDSKGAVDSRLGAIVEKANKLIEIISLENRIVIEKGFSFYIQAEIHNDEDCLIKMLEHIIKNFNSEANVSFINIGGGATIQRIMYSMPTIEKALKHFGAKYIVLEPGRYMVNNVEDMYVSCLRVVDNRQYQNEVVASLSAGIYHGLIDIQLHKREFYIYIQNGENLVKLEKIENDNEPKLILRGPTADSLDNLSIYKLPHCTLNNETIFVIKNVGAYVEVLHSDFSGKIKLKFIKEK